MILFLLWIRIDDMGKLFQMLHKFSTRKSTLIQIDKFLFYEGCKYDFQEIRCSLYQNLELFGADGRLVYIPHNKNKPNSILNALFGEFSVNVDAGDGILVRNVAHDLFQHHFDFNHTIVKSSNLLELGILQNEEAVDRLWIFLWHNISDSMTNRKW